MQTNIDTAPHVEEINRALQGTVPPDTIRKELERYLAHGVPLHQAKRDLLMSLAGGRPVRKKVASVTVNDQAVDLIARVVTMQERQVTARGEAKTIWSGLLGDETGVIPYTAWRQPDFAPGKVVEIGNAYVTTWQGNPQINLGDRTQIAASDEHIEVPPPARRGIKCVVKELAPGMSSVALKARVLSVAKRQIEVQGEPRTLWEGELADQTGRVPFTAWHDHNLVAGSVVQIENAYVRAFRGIASVNFGENSDVKTLGDAELPPAAELEKAKHYDLDELERSGGARGVRVNAVVLEVREGSGLVMRCPECRRVLQKRECRLHGKVEGYADLRIKAVVDDGTGAVTALFNRVLTEEVLGRSLEQCQEAAKAAMSFDVIADEIAGKLLCRRMVFEGNAATDEFGTTLIVSTASFDPLEDLPKRAEALLERLQTLATGVSA